MTSAERRSLSFWKAQNGKQSGDPAKLARALIIIASQEPPPRRFIAGADAIAIAEQKVADLKAQIAANRDLSTSLDFDPSAPPRGRCRVRRKKEPRRKSRSGHPALALTETPHTMAA